MGFQPPIAGGGPRIAGVLTRDSPTGGMISLEDTVAVVKRHPKEPRRIALGLAPTGRATTLGYPDSNRHLGMTRQWLVRPPEHMCELVGLPNP